MAERKVLTKYYPPDFDPAKIERRNRTKSTKAAPPGPKTQVVRLMAPFSMKCTSCGEYIYKGRKFNARKETTEERYLAITIFRFYIRCTRCSSEITFKTDPKHMDYACERGARRNFEVWRERVLGEETDEERLDRLEREESERDGMVELERKRDEAVLEMRVADALDDVRTRNAARERTDGEGTALLGPRAKEGAGEEERERVEREIEEEARLAFLDATGERVRRVDMMEIELDEALEDDGGSMRSSGAGSSRDVEGEGESAIPPPPAVKKVEEKEKPIFQRQVKKKKDFAAALGIKKKPMLV